MRHCVKAFPNDKLKEFADNSLKFDENDGKFYKRVKNTVEKEEIACYTQFLLFQQHTTMRKKSSESIVGKGCFLPN